MDLTGPDPGAAASHWIAVLRAGDFDTAWAVTTTDFRVAHAQAWITAHRGILGLLPGNVKPDDLARALSSEEPDHEMWQYLRSDVERQVHTALRGILNGPEMAVTTRSRPIGRDLELVHVSRIDYLPSTDAIATGECAHAVASINIVLRRAPKGWRIAGLDDHLPVPGWPPTSERIAETGD